MDRIVVIANPSASQFTGGAHRQVMTILRKAAPVEAAWPESAAEAEQRAARAVESGADVVVAMGGDGMVHHVAQGVAGTAAALGVIPVGTSNVFARLMEIPTKPGKAARLLLQAEPRSLGTARMTLTRGTVETVHHAVFACGVGLDAAVVLAADREPHRKYRFGSVHYARTALGVALWEYPKIRPHVSLEVKGRRLEVSAAQVQFRQVYTYFGRVPLRISPQPPHPMTVLALTRLRRIRIPRIVATLARGRDLDSIPEMSTFHRVERVELVADPPVATQADGESLGLVDRGVVEWAPSTIRVIAPQPSS